LGYDSERDFLALAQQRELATRADVCFGQKLMQIVHRAHRRITQSDNHVAIFESSLRGGTFFLDGNHQHTAFGFELLRTHDETRDRDVLSTDAKIGPANASVHDEVAGDEFCGIDRDRKAESLCRKNDSGVNADHLAVGVDQRSAGISRIERRIGLNDVID
jgi:hypothetical protein